MADNTAINCNAQGEIFNGVSECGAFSTGDYVGTWVTKKGTTIPNDTTFLTKVKEAVQKNNLLPFKGYDYRNAHEDNVVNTSSIGNEKLVRLGKPKFEVDLTSSICEMKSVSKINNSSDKWDFWNVYENAVICATTSAGEFTGFDCNVVHLESTKLKQGSDLQMKTLKAQLRSSTQYNEGMTLIPITPELAELKELTGIIGVNIVVTQNSLTDFAVVVTDVCSKNGIDGLTDLGFWQILGTLAPNTIVGVTTTGNGNYVISLDVNTADGDKVGFKLAEATFESVLLDGNYYGGSSALITVVD